MYEKWVPTALGDVATQVFEPVEVHADISYVNLGVKWYAEGTFSRGPKLGSQIKASRLFSVRPGQFIYNRLFATEGSFAVVRSTDVGSVVSNEFPVFDLDATRLEPQYLYLYFQQRAVWNRVALECEGTTKSRNRWKEERFIAHSVALPSVRIQRRIIDVMASLDSTLEAEKIARDSTQMLLDRGRDKLPESPERAISEVLRAIESGTSTRPVVGDGPSVRVLTLAAIRPGVFRASETKDVGPAALPSKALLGEGDLLITRSNTPDRVGYVCVARDVPPRTYLPDLVWRLVPASDTVTPEYLEHLLSSPIMRSRITALASGTSESMRKINKAKFGALTVPIPDSAIQATYVAPLAAMALVVAEHENTIQGLQALRANLLSVLLSGEHEIPESYDELMEA